jgi:hypothetical protein
MPIIGFWADDARVTLALLALQLLVWAMLKIPFSEFSQLRRIRRFAFIILLAFSFFYGDSTISLLSLGNWSLGISQSGFLTGMLMIAKLLIMLLAAQIVCFCTPASEMILGMQRLGMSRDSAEVMSALMNLVSGSERRPGTGGGGGGGNGEGRQGNRQNGHGAREGRIYLKTILTGDLTGVYDRIDAQREKISAQFSNSDMANIASSSALIVLVRFIKIAPGLPIAPGHKNVLIVPFFIAGSQHSKTNLSGAKIGFFSGVIHFLSGFGKYGPLGILQFVLLGAVIDAMLFLLRRPSSLLISGLIGLIAGLFRVISEIFIAWILNVPLEFYLFYLPFIVSHCLFGALSAPVTKQLLTRFSNT